MKRAHNRCEYLDTVARSTLDFDKARVCSATLADTNVYACCVCGKFFRGRGKSTPAYAHAIDEDHHVFVNLETTALYCLPDLYEVQVRVPPPPPLLLPLRLLTALLLPRCPSSSWSSVGALTHRPAPLCRSRLSTTSSGACGRGTPRPTWPSWTPAALCPATCRALTTCRGSSGSTTSATPTTSTRWCRRWRTCGPCATFSSRASAPGWASRSGSGSLSARCGARTTSRARSRRTSSPRWRATPAPAASG